MAYFESLSNWNRWGPQDELGTLNLITPATRLAALRCVKEGRAISCSRTISPKPASDNMQPLLHFMVTSGESAGSGKATAADWIGMPVHGHGITHLDALSHEFWDGKMYNGRPATTVSTATGAAKSNIESSREGVFTRGVLLDLPRLSNRGWLEPGTLVTPDELDQCCSSESVEVGPGDALIIRTGRDARKASHGHYRPMVDGVPGLHASCLPWLREHGVALLGSDSVSDAIPSGLEQLDMPIHIIGIVAMGLWLLDNCDLEELADSCSGRDQWDFLFVTAPLRLKNSTGSPVNPLAIV